MANLTVAEKEHWKERISRRIDKRIEAISAQDPLLMEGVQREARSRALTSLGITELMAERQQIETQQDDLDRRDQELIRRMYRQIASPQQEENHYPRSHAEHAVDRAIARRQTVHEE